MHRALQTALRDPTLPRKLLVSIVLVLTAIGTVMVFSASFYHRGIDGDAFLFLRRQLLWVPIAALTGMVVRQLDYRLLARWYPWVYAITVVLLVLVFVPGLGIRVNYSNRWIRAGNFQFQPSELAKLTVMIFVAGFFSCDMSRLTQFRRGFVPLAGGTVLLFGLVLLEPDFGTAMFILGLSGFLVILSGARRIYVFGSLFLFSPVIGLYVFLRWEMISNRLLGFLEPMNVYQVRHSLLALGSGGWFGIGLGAGKQKLSYLPEPQTDFIFSVLGEEVGFVGCMTIIALFVAMLWVSIVIARRAREYFGFLLASGITVSIAMQAVTNIAVVTASVPTKGIPLPFMTFGGSGLCTTFAQIGLLLAIDARTREAVIGGADLSTDDETDGRQAEGTERESAARGSGRRRWFAV